MTASLIFCSYADRLFPAHLSGFEIESLSHFYPIPSISIKISAYEKLGVP